MTCSDEVVFWGRIGGKRVLWTPEHVGWYDEWGNAMTRSEETTVFALTRLFFIGGKTVLWTPEHVGWSMSEGGNAMTRNEETIVFALVYTARAHLKRITWTPSHYTLSTIPYCALVCQSTALLFQDGIALVSQSNVSPFFMRLIPFFIDDFVPSISESDSFVPDVQVALGAQSNVSPSFMRLISFIDDFVLSISESDSFVLNVQVALGAQSNV